MTEKSEAAAKSGKKRVVRKNPRAGQPRGRRVTFRYQGEPGHQVFVAGTFNEWAPEDRALTDKAGNGEYAVCLLLKPGRYEYKLVVDGQWILDPANPQESSNDYGTRNNVLDVPEA